jgi:16S rRNA G966 N2-methylase RsmD
VPQIEQRIVLADVLKLQDPRPYDFDAMIVDPPYSAHVHDKAVSQSAKGGVRSRDMGFGCLTDELRDTIMWWASRVRRWSLVYSDIEGLHAWRASAKSEGVEYVRHIPWVRWTMPQLSGDRPPSGCEMVTVFWGSAKGRKSWSGPGNTLSLAHKALRGSKKHKAEKPLDQALDLVQWFTRPGDRVVDLCAGSGTTGLACRILGRSFVGYEIDPEWADLAAKRIESPRLSPRDAERHERWLVSQEAERIDFGRRRGRFVGGDDTRVSSPKGSS